MSQMRINRNGGSSREVGSAAAQRYWTSDERALGYLAQADALPHRDEGESVLLDQLPRDCRRVLDLGTGDGRLPELLRRRRPGVSCVGLDFSSAMLDSARRRFAREDEVVFMYHDLTRPLPDIGSFDAIVTSLATHNLSPERQRTLYEDVFEMLVPGGVFCNLEHVGSSTPRLHEAFYGRIAHMSEFNHQTCETVALSTHLRWLRELEFDDVDCHWKWLEIALIGGVRRG
jgi:tRNA (cmo5U34)-methyltransferase